jgi:hypothetical protein
MIPKRPVVRMWRIKGAIDRFLGLATPEGRDERSGSNYVTILRLGNTAGRFFGSAAFSFMAIAMLALNLS